MTNQTASPCIKICQLDDDAICTGCYRSAFEIGAWSKADNASQQAILATAQQRQLDYAARRRNNNLASNNTANK